MTLDPEVVNTPINPTGEGEAEVIKDLVSPEYENLTPSQTVPILLALEKLAAGQNSMLAKIEQKDTAVQDQLNNLYARLDERERAEKAYQENNQEFIENAMEQAKSLQVTDPKEQAKIRAKAQQDLQNRTVAARSHRRLSTAEMKVKIESEPKEMVTSTGEHILVSQPGGGVQSKIIPEHIIIGDLTYTFPIGQPVKVPRSVAQAYRNKKKDEADAREFQSLMSVSPKLKKDVEIGKQFPQFPIASNA